MCAERRELSEHCILPVKRCVEWTQSKQAASSTVPAVWWLCERWLLTRHSLRHQLHLPAAACRSANWRTAHTGTEPEIKFTQPKLSRQIDGIIYGRCCRCTNYSHFGHLLCHRRAAGWQIPLWSHCMTDASVSMVYCHVSHSAGAISALDTDINHREDAAFQSRHLHNTIKDGDVNTDSLHSPLFVFVLYTVPSRGSLSVGTTPIRWVQKLKQYVGLRNPPKTYLLHALMAKWWNAMCSSKYHSKVRAVISMFSWFISSANQFLLQGLQLILHVY